MPDLLQSQTQSAGSTWEGAVGQFFSIFQGRGPTGKK